MLIEWFEFLVTFDMTAMLSHTLYNVNAVGSSEIERIVQYIVVVTQTYLRQMKHSNRR